MIDWGNIETVFLDMDGTLLDLHFDNFFWREHVPNRYAELHQIKVDTAKRLLYKRFQEMEGTIDWYCVDYWTEQLGLDIALLKQEVDHLIAVHPHVVDFLDALRKLSKRVVLVTNAHGKSLRLKMEKTQLGGHFDQLVCAHDLGRPKEDPVFWQELQTIEAFEKNSTLMVDDSLSVLRSARQYGIRFLLAITLPDTRAPVREVDEFDSIRDFSALLPIGSSV